ncbi:MAG TPA: aminodeoxychorismate synthase component I [Paludibacter sp.]|nr:aminodeoxychorismate synthase component I [Paludibacter sp.]
MKKEFPYPMLDRIQMIHQINLFSEKRIPFLFIIDYKAENGYVIKQDEINDTFIRFSTNDQSTSIENKSFTWNAKPVSYESYKNKFDSVVNEIKRGNSFLVNLTQPAEVNTNLTLSEIYNFGNAKYKLWLKDKFTVLSPETFVQIRSGIISSFPMKGTIDAAIPNAETIIINDLKEKAEHATIVDLIRNDLSIVVRNVHVKRYRYIDKLVTNKGELLQVSSEICGSLPENYYSKTGDILFSLLPAGSICGAPKQKTLEIIENAEGYDRGFYTGVCGWFDGENLDSAVMIRFIEQQNEQLIFKSGGGITCMSDLKSEYDELIQKIYVQIS